MKTITLTFREPDGVVVALAIGKFETLPGPGPVVWQGSTAPIGDRTPPAEHYAEQFAEALTALGKSNGFEVRVDEVGEWDVIEGDL